MDYYLSRYLLIRQYILFHMYIGDILQWTNGKSGVKLKELVPTSIEERRNHGHEFK